MKISIQPSMKMLRPICSAVVLWIVFALLLPSHLQAQIKLLQGKKLPKSGQENDWFLETKDMHIWHVYKGKWSMFRVTRCTQASIYHQFLLLHFEDGSLELVRASGKQAAFHTEARFQFQCYDSISTMEFGSNFIIFDIRGNTLASLDMKNCTGQHMVAFRGKAAFCVPRYANGATFGPLACTELKDWGVLGTHGQWLIAPKFDAPFHFENGVAEVIYYGEKRKINEQGEFVE